MQKDQIERLVRVGESIGAEFYQDRDQLTYTTLWGCEVSFNALEIVSVQSDEKLKQWIINRTVRMLREQIDHLESLR